MNVMAMRYYDEPTTITIESIPVNLSETKKLLKFLSYNVYSKPCEKNQNILPKDVQRVIINNRSVTVILTNNNKGTSSCSEADEFDPYVGFCIAYYKAKNKKNYELKKALNGCVDNAKKKGYKQAILNGK
jgi:hypothetical protein